MSYKFIIGACASGKSSKILEMAIDKSIEDKNSKHLIIVPEQYNMYMQKELVTRHKRQATTNIDVLSFNRLAIKVFKELNIELPSILDDITKAIIIRKIALNNKQNLNLWKDKFSKYGFLEKFISLISQLYQYNISKEQISSLISDENTKKSNLLNTKLKDIELIYRDFDEFIKDKNILKEEILEILCKYLSSSKLIKNSYIYFDAFTGFIPSQYKVIEILMSEAFECNFSICADCKNINNAKLQEDDLFYMSMLMAKNISDLADKNMIRQKESIFLDKTYIKSEAISHLEKNFLRNKLEIKDRKSVYNIVKIDKNIENSTQNNIENETKNLNTKAVESDFLNDRNKNKADIRIISALNQEKEVDFVVNEINNLVKKENYRYRDIAIIAGDLSPYIDKFNIKLSSEYIPYHIDTNIQIHTNIFINFINSLIELIIRNYNYDSVMQFIRNPFIEDFINEYDLYSLDTYMYTTGIYSYKKFSKAFTYMPRKYKGSSLDRLNNIREFILDISKNLYEIFNKKNKDKFIEINKLTSELKNIFEKLEVEKILLKLSEKFKKDNDEKRSREYENIYQSVLDLFDKLDELLKDEKLKNDEFLELFNAGLSQLEIGLVPSVIDSVFIGDIIRSRVPRVKAIFIIGVNEGIIPNISNSYSLISDREKEFLEKEYNISLSPTLRKNIYEQRYYLYLALSKADYKLYLSYANMNEKMEAMKASFLLKDIRNLFIDLEDEELREIENINSLNDLKTKTSILLRENYNCDEFFDLLDMLYEESLGEKEKLEEKFKLEKAKNPDNSYSLDDLYNKEDKEFEYELLKKTNENIEKLSKYKESFDKLKKISDFEYKDVILGEEISDKIFGHILKISASSLEKYAACAYRHFVNYGLNLEQRRKYSIDSMDIGNLFHLSLDKIFKNYIEFSQKNEYKDSETALNEYYLNVHNKIEDIVDSILKEQEENKYIDTSRSEYIKKNLVKQLNINLKILFEHLKSGKFVPNKMEYAFKLTDDKVYDIYINKNKKMYLEGKIDRIDIYDKGLDIDCDNQNLVLKILDYKTGEKKWDTDLAIQGLQMQLALYMDICIKMYKQIYDKQIEPGAILYFNAKEKLINKEIYKKAYNEEKENLGRELSKEEQKELIEKLLMKEYQPSGLINSSKHIIKALDKKMYELSYSNETKVDKKNKNITYSEVKSDILNAKTIAKIENEEIKSWELNGKDIVSIDEMQEILFKVNEKVKEIALKIASADISVNPVSDTNLSCKYCNYKAICGFDKNIKGYEYRKIKNNSISEENDEMD